MLDHHHGVAGIRQLVQHFEQLADILEMQAGSGFVEDVERLAGRPARQFLGQLHPLRLAAGQGGGLLADLDVAQPHPLQRGHLLSNGRDGLEEVMGLVDGHFEDIGDRLALEQDLERFAVVAPTLADVAGHVDVGQEMHLDLDQAIALARLATPALDVEAEPPRSIAPGLGFREACEPVPDRLEGPGVGGRVRARGPPDGGLVDVDDLVEVLKALDPVMGRGGVRGVVEPPCSGLVEGLDGEGGLPPAGDAGYAGQGPDGNLSRHGLQVVAGRPADPEDPGALHGAPLVGEGDLCGPAKISPGEAVRIGHDLARPALADDPAAIDPGARAHVDHMVGGQDRLLVMLDDQDRVAEVPQAAQAVEKAGVVPLVQADGRLIQHIEHAGQAGADLAG